MEDILWWYSKKYNRKPCLCCAVNGPAALPDRHMGILKSESYRRGVINSTILNMVAKAVGFINSLLIINLFGPVFETDIYFLILATVALLSGFVNGMDNLVLIPEAMRLRYSSGPLAENAFLNYFIRIYIIIGAVIALLVLISPVLFYSVFSDFRIADLRQKEQLLFLSAFLFPVQLLNSLFTSILSSHKYFTASMFTALVNSIFSIVLLLSLNGVLGIYSAVIAVLSGYCINFLWLAYYMWKELHWRFFLPPKRPLKKFMHAAGLMMLNILPVSLRSYFTVYLITGIGAGVITSYNYGQQLSLLPHNLIAIQLIAVAGVKLNELSSRNEEAEMNRFTTDLLRLLYFVMLPVGAVIALSSADITQFLFGYSQKIKPEALSSISLVIFFMALTLPNVALDLALTRVVMARQKIKEGVVYAVLTHFVFVILVFAGVRLLGLKGFLIAYLAGNTLFLPALYYFVLKKSAPFIKYLDWIRSSAGFILFNLLLMTLLLLLKQLLPGGIYPVLMIAATGVVYVTAVLIFNRVTGYYKPANQFLDKFLFSK